MLTYAFVTMLYSLINANILKDNKVYVNEGAGILQHGILPLDDRVFHIKVVMDLQIKGNLSKAANISQNLEQG